MRLRPCFVVGIPVILANFDFALLIPSARFQLKPGMMLFLLLAMSPSLYQHLPQNS